MLVHGAFSLRHRLAARRGRAVDRRADRLEPLHAARRGQLVAACGRAGISLHQHVRQACARGLLVQRAQLHGRRRVHWPDRGRFRALRQGGREPRGCGRVRLLRGRRGRGGRPLLVPRRLVGPADACVEQRGVWPRGEQSARARPRARRVACGALRAQARRVADDPPQHLLVRAGQRAQVRQGTRRDGRARLPSVAVQGCGARSAAGRGLSRQGTGQHLRSRRRCLAGHAHLARVCARQALSPFLSRRRRV